MPYSIAVLFDVRHLPVLSNRRYFGPIGSRAVQNGTSHVITVLPVPLMSVTSNRRDSILWFSEHVKSSLSKKVKFVLHQQGV